MAHAEALGLARSGRLEAARRSSSRAVDLALQEGDHEAAASYQAARAVWEALSGNAAEGKKERDGGAGGFARTRCRIRRWPGAGLRGNSISIATLADDLEKRFPEDTFAKFTYVPVLRALAALERGKPADSVEGLQIALRYELAVNGLNFNHFYLGGLHSAYLRGEAFLATHRYAEAIAEFQKILDHRGIVGAVPLARSRTGASGKPTLYQEKRSKRKAPTMFSSRFGKTPTATSRFSSKPRPNTLACSERDDAELSSVTDPSVLCPERQALREDLGLKDGSALSAVPVVRHNIEIISVGLDGHTRGLQIVAFIPARQQHLSNWNAVPVEHQHTALAIHGHVEVTVVIGTHRVRCGSGEMVRDGCAEWRNAR